MIGVAASVRKQSHSTRRFFGRNNQKFPLLTPALNAPRNANSGLDPLRAIKTSWSSTRMNSLLPARQAHLPALQLWEFDCGHERSIFNADCFNMARTRAVPL
jgi:hypothetical protein